MRILFLLLLAAGLGLTGCSTLMHLQQLRLDPGAEQVGVATCEDSYFGTVMDLRLSSGLSVQVRFTPLSSATFIGPLLLPLVPIRLKLGSGPDLLEVVLRRNERGILSPEAAMLPLSSLFLRLRDGRKIYPEKAEWFGGKEIPPGGAVDLRDEGVPQLFFSLEQKDESQLTAFSVAGHSLNLHFEKKWSYWPFVFMDASPGWLSCTPRKKAGA